MAKEFDIYLNKRLTECDIIVYSIPFRDGLTATNRMILESCLESYTLQKFIAVETGSELVSHIDKMIKTCNERLHMASTWGIDLEFQTHYVLNPVPTVIEIAPNDDLQTLRNIFHDGKLLCVVTSENAHQFFARDDDGAGMLRGKLTQAIQKTLAKRDANYQNRWDKVWDDPACQPYKRIEYADFWLWNHDFFNADIDTLRHIAKLVGAKEVA